MLVPFPMSPSFSLGARVRRSFDQGIHVGTVTDLYEDEGQPLWKVVYNDFDSEDLSEEELVEALVYHPILDNSIELDVLEEVGPFRIVFGGSRSTFRQVSGDRPNSPVARDRFGMSPIRQGDPTFDKV